MDSITLTWQILDEDHVALIFDKAALSAFRLLAQCRGIRTDEMIGNALAALLDMVPDSDEGIAQYN
jgi:hypothetical protein